MAGKAVHSRESILGVVVEHLKAGKALPAASLYSATFGIQYDTVKRHFPEGIDAFLELARKEAGVTVPVVELQDRKELNSLRARVKQLEDENLSSHKIKELIGTLAVDHTPPEWLTPKRYGKGLTGIPFLFLSDIHFDEVVRAEQIGGVNAYNRTIATKRLQHTFNQAIALTCDFMRDPKYDGFVLALGGDLLSGNIHEELAETNEAHINQSIITLTDILISGIDRLLERFGRVFVPCVVGNHGRHHKKPRAKGRVFDNYEWIIYQMIARHYQGDKRVRVHIPDSADAEFSVYNLRFLLTHGDQFKGGNGIGGIMVPIMRGLAHKQKRQAAIDRPFDVAVMGHWHQLVMTENTIINGSVKGYDEYAYISNFGFEPAQQALFIIHPEHGITYRMPVRCDGYAAEPTNAQPLTVW